MNRKQLLSEMSETIHKFLLISRHEHLSLTGIIIFTSFVDAVRIHNTRMTLVLNLKDTYVGTIIWAQVKNLNGLESALQSTADVILKHYDTVLRKEIGR